MSKPSTYLVHRMSTHSDAKVMVWAWLRADINHRRRRHRGGPGADAVLLFRGLAGGWHDINYNLIPEYQ